MYGSLRQGLKYLPSFFQTKAAHLGSHFLYCSNRSTQYHTHLATDINNDNQITKPCNPRASADNIPTLYVKDQSTGLPSLSRHARACTRPKKRRAAVIGGRCRTFTIVLFCSSSQSVFKVLLCDI